MVTFIICKQKLRGTLYADGAGWLVNQEKVEMWETGWQSRPRSARYHEFSVVRTVKVAA